MRKRVARARASCSPRMLLLDDRSAGLDRHWSVIDELIISLPKNEGHIPSPSRTRWKAPFPHGNANGYVVSGEIIEEAEFEESSNPKIRWSPSFLSGSTEGPFWKASLDAIQEMKSMTGLHVVGTIAVVAFLWFCSAHRDCFRPLVTIRLFDNAAGIKQARRDAGGRNIGSYKNCIAPSPDEEKEADSRGAIHSAEESQSQPKCKRPANSDRRRVGAVDKAQRFPDAKTR